jgi:hypothetical protein
MFLGSAWSRFSVPTCATSIASRAAMVKTGQRPPPKAARSGLDDREHGATLKQVGNIVAAGLHWALYLQARQRVTSCPFSLAQW